MRHSISVSLRPSIKVWPRQVFLKLDQQFNWLKQFDYVVICLYLTIMGWHHTFLLELFQIQFQIHTQSDESMIQILHYKSHAYWVPIIYSPSDNHGLFWIEDSLLFLNMNFMRATQSLWLPSKRTSHSVHQHYPRWELWL